jgi:hypothetical protein
LGLFEEEFERFLQEQQRSATGQRLEMLKRDLSGTIKLLETAVWPVMRSFDGLVLEQEMISISGVKIYGDLFIPQIMSLFEAEGYAVHAENISRDRFAFEKMRIRTIAMYGYKFIPFSWDELDRKPEFCRRAVFELLGRFSHTLRADPAELGVKQREIIRYAMRLHRPFRLADVCAWLSLTAKPSRLVIRDLIERKLIRPTGIGKIRNHEFVLEEQAGRYL